MSLPLVDERTPWLSKKRRFEVFCKTARYQPEHDRSGSDRYAICVGYHVGGTLFSSDTHDLLDKFEAWVRRRRRKK